jgi:hypothetical protein
MNIGALVGTAATLMFVMAFFIAYLKDRWLLYKSDSSSDNLEDFLPQYSPPQHQTSNNELPPPYPH